ncbi:MAG: ABC transporter ATP-binding protein [Pleomorphochaeta sp.]
MSEPIVKLSHITKQFPGVLANDDVSMDVHKGEILALLGENGAGKTTLMNILYGLISKDAGEIIINGEKAIINSPRDALKYGIGMVHQHFMLVKYLSVAENLILGDEPTIKGRLDKKKTIKLVKECSKKYGLDVHPNSLVADISVGEQQRLEILKTLYRGAKVLILDEPTAVLTPQKVRELYSVLRELKAQGHSIIIITHKLQEILDISDRVVVMRTGQVIGIENTCDVTKKMLAEMMVGRPVLLNVNKKEQEPKEVLFKVENLRAKDSREIDVVNGVNFEVKAGEIVGIAGIDGNGQSEMLRVFAGLLKPEEGQVSVCGNTLPLKFTPKMISDLGVSHISEDRHHWGLVLEYSVAENLILGLEADKKFKKGVLMDSENIAKHAKALIEEYDIRTPSEKVLAGSLSGGNQQKVVLARGVSKDPKVLIAAQPTRGLDVGAIESVYKILLDQREKNKAILLVSYELDEIFALSDRILVMFDGKIVANFKTEETTREEVGLYMGGGMKESD